MRCRYAKNVIAFMSTNPLIFRLGSFLPVVLEQLARERGVWRSDTSTPCTTPLSSGKDDNQCVVHLFGTDTNTSSFALYTFSVGVMVQAITLVSVSSIADHGKKALDDMIPRWIHWNTTVYMFLLNPLRRPPQALTAHLWIHWGDLFDAIHFDRPTNLPSRCLADHHLHYLSWLKLRSTEFLPSSSGGE